MSKPLCPGAGSAPGAESFGRPTGRAGPRIRAGTLLICHCIGLNDVDLKQANPVGQTALHCAVVLHGPKTNLVSIPEDEKRRCCQVAAAEENVVPGAQTWQNGLAWMCLGPCLSRHSVQQRTVAGCPERKLLITMPSI